MFSGVNIPFLQHNAELCCTRRNVFRNGDYYSTLSSTLRLRSEYRSNTAMITIEINGRPEWDEYFIKMAELVSARSKDPKCQVGAVIVGEEKVVLATGYNGPARGVLDLQERLNERDEKLRWMCHAEVNAIFNAARVGTALKGGTIYVTKFPCAACANAIVQVGLVRLYTLDDETWKNDPSGDDGTRSLRILNEGRVNLHAPKMILLVPNGSRREEAAVV
jgi:dCMP deaminase